MATIHYFPDDPARTSRLLPSITLVGAYQDGGDFYREGSGKLLARYDVVQDDHDMTGATIARMLFAKDHPAFIKQVA